MTRYACPGCGRQVTVSDVSTQAAPIVCGACGTAFRLPDQALLAAAAMEAGRPRRPPVRVEWHGPGPGWWVLLGLLVLAAAAIPTTILLMHRETPTNSALAAVADSGGRADAPSPTHREEDRSTAPPERPRETPSQPAASPADVRSEPVAPQATRVEDVTLPPAPPMRPAPFGKRPLTASMPIERPQGLTDEQVGQALQRGVEFLLAHFRDGQVQRLTSEDSESGTPQWREGLNALCVYALLQASRSSTDERLGIKGPFMRGALQHLKSAPMEPDAKGSWQPVTYGRGLRASALAVYDRPEDRDTMKADVAWLVRAAVLGAYTYDDRYAGAGTPGPNAGFRAEDVPWDHSNSQYGVLGVWSCAEAGVEVPPAYWRGVEDHWVRWQLGDGEWGYKKTDETGSLAMTAAGIASLLVTSDWLGSGANPRTGAAQQPSSRALMAGLNWLEQGDHGISVGDAKSFYRGYDRFSLERVGLASGFKDFGTHDWYRELTADLLRRQGGDGSWGAGLSEQDRLIETAYDVLFLARGRHPILLSKLRFDGPWSDHPRDAANLARYATRELERVINWQVVSIDRDWTDWADSPLLYIASHADPKLTDEQCEKLRQFVNAGGMLFTQSDDGSPSFEKWVTELAAKLWPEYRFEPIPDDHEIYQLHARLTRTAHPKLRGVSNGSRLLLVHSPTDLAAAWQQRAERARPEAFRLGLNLFLYATGKAPGNRILSAMTESAELPERAAAPTDLRVARLRYAGTWDPEPSAWIAFGHALQRETGVGVDAVQVDVRDLKPESAPVAHLTGTRAVTLDEGQITALRQYVEGGGVLLIDACGGQASFADSIRGHLLGEAFPGSTSAALSAGDPLTRASVAGMIDLGQPRLRPYAIAKLEQDQPPAAYAVQVIRFGKGTVLWSPLDLTTGLLGANPWGVLGYEPRFARSFVRNVLLNARAHAAQR